MPKELTTKQKCEKLAKVLETLSVKFTDPELGEKLWEAEEHTIKLLVSEISALLSKATEISNDAPPRSIRRLQKRIPAKKQEQEDDWPDIITE